MVYSGVKTDFSTCWPEDRLKAQGLVSQIQKIVNVKDSFTRMRQEKDRERQENIRKREEEVQRIQDRKETVNQVKNNFYALFSEPNARKRGKDLEGVLNQLFQVYGISVRDAFTVNGDDGEGIVEQIDGVIELDGHLYFVEMKWWQEPVGVREISSHMMRVFLRAESRAIVISNSEFTTPAVTACKKALSQKVVSLCTLEELVMLLGKQGDLVEFFRRKVQAAIVDQNPFLRMT